MQGLFTPAAASKGMGHAPLGTQRVNALRAVEMGLAAATRLACTATSKGLAVGKGLGPHDKHTKE